MEKKNNVTYQRLKFSSDDWETPPALYKKVDRIFGFTLDPCATKENAKCERFFTVARDGLGQSWARERVWCNPPYSEWPSWIEKTVAEAEKGAVIVFLMPPRSGTIAWHRYAMKADGIIFLKGRVQFYLEGQKIQRNPSPSVLLIFDRSGEWLNRINMSVIRPGPISFSWSWKERNI